MLTKYPAYEVFKTIQGEGAYAGTPMVLLRLMGCDQKCPWCDAAGTWHPDYKPKTTQWIDPEEFASAYVEKGTRVLITGGEPTLYDLSDLTHAIHSRGGRTHLETAGHHPVRGLMNWVTLSPKLFTGAMPPVREAMRVASELKLIIESPENLKFQLSWLRRSRPYLKPLVPVWLHPEWSQRNNPVVLNAILDAVINQDISRVTLRAGWQLHKLYLADPNPQGVTVPLGGNPDKGSSI